MRPPLAEPVEALARLALRPAQHRPPRPPAPLDARPLLVLPPSQGHHAQPAMAVNASSMGVVATTSSLVDLFFNSPATQTVIVSLLANSGKDLVAGGVPAIQALLQTGAATDMASALGRPAAFIPAAVATEGLVMLTCVSLGDPGLGVVLVIFLSLPAYLLFKMLALGQPDAPPQQPAQPVAGGNVRRARHEPYEVWLGRHVKHWIITVLALAGAFVLAFVLVALADVALQFHRAPSGQEMGRAAIRANGRPPHSASLGGWSRSGSSRLGWSRSGLSRSLGATRCGRTPAIPRGLDRRSSSRRRFAASAATTAWSRGAPRTRTSRRGTW